MLDWSALERIGGEPAPQPASTWDSNDSLPWRSRPRDPNRAKRCSIRGLSRSASLDKLLRGAGIELALADCGGKPTRARGGRLEACPPPNVLPAEAFSPLTFRFRADASAIVGGR